MTDVGPNNSPYYARYYQRFGDRIVANWKKHPNGSTQQDCFMYTYEKAQTAMQQLGGARFPPYETPAMLSARCGATTSTSARRSGCRYQARGAGVEHPAR